MAIFQTMRGSGELRRGVLLLVALFFASCRYANIDIQDPKDMLQDRDFERMGPKVSVGPGSDLDIEKGLDPKMNEASEDLNAWWSSLGDPELDQMIDTLIKENLSIKQLGFRLDQMQAGLQISESERHPSIGLNGGGTWNAKQPTFLNTFNPELQFNVGASVSWVPDVFGRVNAQVKQDWLNLEAVKHDLEAMHQALIARLVTSRIELASLLDQKKWLQEILDNRTKVLNLTQGRYDRGHGGTGSADLYLAKEAVSSLKASLASFDQRVLGTRHAINVLLGKWPSTPQEDPAFLDELPKTIPDVLPIHLLDRRPDLKASQLRMEASKKGIDVAVRRLYPSLQFQATPAFRSTGLSSLFRKDRFFMSLVGSISAILFQGGRLKANIRRQGYNAQEMATAYAEQILNAVSEVERLLYNEHKLAEAYGHQKDAAKHLNQAFDAFEQRFVAGLIPLKTLLDIAQRKQSLEQAAIGMKQQLWTNRVSLILALGGSWTSEHVLPTQQKDVEDE